MLDTLLLIVGLAVLTYGADRFVLGAARLSTALRISPVVIGAVVIGFGTSTPEFVVTILATLGGSQDLAFGNVVGSNTANVLLVLGTAGLFCPIAISVATLRREVPLMLAGVFLLAAATINLRVTAVDAAALLVAAALSLGLIVWVALRDRQAAAVLEAEVAEYGSDEISLTRSALIAALGLVGTLVGAQMVVHGATGLALALGITEAVIGLTVVAIGTSLPELVTAVAAARRGEADLVVGNVLGSNLFNSLPVAGVAGALDTVQLAADFRGGVLIMIVSCAGAAVFLWTGRRLGRRESSLLLVGFAVATALTF